MGHVTPQRKALVHTHNILQKVRCQIKPRQMRGVHIFKINELLLTLPNLKYENYDIAIAMSSSLADPVLGHCTGWVYLNN